MHLQIIAIEFVTSDAKSSDTFTVRDTNATEGMFLLNAGSLPGSVVNSTRLNADFCYQYYATVYSFC